MILTGMIQRKLAEVKNIDRYSTGQMEYFINHKLHIKSSESIRFKIISKLLCVFLLLV